MKDGEREKENSGIANRQIVKRNLEKRIGDVPSSLEAPWAAPINERTPSPQHAQFKFIAMALLPLLRKNSRLFVSKYITADPPHPLQCLLNLES